MSLEQVKKSVLTTVASFASKNRAMLDTAADFVPQARIARRVHKIAIAIVAIVCIVLVIISIALFTQKHQTAGIWVLGAGLWLAAFSTWFHFYRQGKIGALEGGCEPREGGDEFEILDNVYKEYTPQEYDYISSD